MTPKPGDAVRLDGWYWGADPGAIAIIDGHRPTTDPGDIMLLFRPDVFRDGEHVSGSGGPCPIIQRSELHHVGTHEAWFWNWGKNLPGRDMGVPYSMTVPLWSWRGIVNDLERPGIFAAPA